MQNARRIAGPFALALLALTPAALAQEVLVEHQGDARNSYYGIDGGVDFDGDQVPDFVLNADVSPDFVVVSGADGSTLQVIRATSGSSSFDSMFYPDVTGDDVPEVVIGVRRGAGPSASPAEVRLVDGATGATLWASPGGTVSELFGTDIRLIGDATGDGRPDVLVAGWNIARLLSGADGARVHAFGSTGACCPSDRVAPAGDLDGDGVPDFLVGSRRFSGDFFGDTTYPQNAGLVRVVSGADGHEIRQHRGRIAQQGVGLEVVSLGDFDRDGVPDYAYGSYFVKSGVVGGGITLCSGKRGRVLWKISLGPTLGIKSGFLLPIAPGDLDKDGFPEFAIHGTSDNGVEFFAIVSGGPTDSPILFRLDRRENDYFGSFGLVGDVDGDGLTDLAVAYTQADVVQVVRMRILPKIPRVVKNARAFTRTSGVGEDLSARLTVTVKNGVQTLSIETSGLVVPGGKFAVTGPFGVWLEDAVGAGSFTKLGSLDASGSYTIVGQGTVPPQLGVQSLADVVGRRVQLRDGAGSPLLETVIPDLVKAKTAAKKATLQPVSPQFPGAKLKISAAFDPRTGAVGLTGKVRNAGTGPFVFELETGAGTGLFEEIARIESAKLKLSTGTGAPLAGAFSLSDLAGRRVRVSAGGTVVLEGTF